MKTELDPYRVEVIADDSGKWVGNGLRFFTPGEAKAYALNLQARWMLVRDWRVVNDHGDVVCGTGAPSFEEQYRAEILRAQAVVPGGRYS